MWWAHDCSVSAPRKRQIIEPLRGNTIEKLIVARKPVNGAQLNG
jgi:hypothetical protein